MKKALLFLLTATIFLLSGCFWSKKPQTNAPTGGSVAAQSPTPSAQSTIKPTEKPATNNVTKDGLIKSEGAFLGMDDSNSLVIIEKSGEKVAEQRYKILEELKLEDSNIEIGQTVEFYYKIEKNGVKTIQKISKKS
jgi:hypothetical protein